MKMPSTSLPLASTPKPSRSNDLWYCFLRLLAQLAAVLGYRIRHWGIRNIPRDGGVLLVSNHQSHLDPPLIGMGSLRRMTFLARETLFRHQPFRWLFNSLHAVSIDREGIGLGGIKESLRRLKRGDIVAIFPEGRRTNDGEIGPFRPGFTALAVRAKTAILPVAVEGAFAAWPRWRKLPRLGTIHVRYGEPLLPAEVAAMDERALLAEVERRVRQCHAELRRHPAFRGRAKGIV
jgi:1-acyl-sn-glycerol-3-phosphate acyltransferase